MAAVTQDFTDTSGKATITFNDYAVENHWLSGSFSIELKKPAGEEEYIYNLLAQDIVLHLPDSIHTLVWNCNQNYYWVEGRDTPQNFDDDVFEVLGTASGTDIDGVSYSCKILEAIPLFRYCAWVSGGLVEIDVPGQDIEDGKIMYNSEACDPFFNLEFNGMVFTENLLNMYRPSLEGAK